MEKMTIDKYLSYEKEKMPNWLENFDGDKPLDVNEVFYGSNRIVFYPGSGIDGEPIKLINKAHYAHTYFYVDYNHRREDIRKILIKNETFKGYKTIGLYTCPVYIASRLVSDHSYYNMRTIFNSEDLIYESMNYPLQKGIFIPFLYIAIYERLPNYDETHGAKRFCLIYLCNDMFGAYYEFFSSRNMAPNILILKNYESNEFFMLGKGSNLEFLAKEKQTYPDYILCERNTDVWKDYEKINIAKKEYLDPNKKEVLTLYKNQDFERCLSFDEIVI